MMRAKGSLARAGTLVSDTVTRDATLRDALEAVLTDNAGRVAVTGRRGEYTGVVDMETLMNSVHELLEADRLEAMEASTSWRRPGPSRRTPSRKAPAGRRRRDHSRAGGRGDGGRGRAAPTPPKRRISWQKLTFLPAALVAILLATWLWFNQAHLDAISENALSNGQVSKALWQHVQLTVISTFFVLIIAIPLGILLTRGRSGRPPRWR
jgi:hypothetical protein